MGLFRSRQDTGSATVNWPKSSILAGLRRRYKIEILDESEITEGVPHWITVIGATSGEIKFLIVLVCPPFLRDSVADIGFILSVSGNVVSSSTLDKINKGLQIAFAGIDDSGDFELSAWLGFKVSFSSKVLDRLLDLWDADWRFAIKVLVHPWATAKALLRSNGALAQRYVNNFKSTTAEVEKPDTRPQHKGFVVLRP